MADSTEALKPVITKTGVVVVGNSAAPIVYWDGVGTFGTHHGIIQIEVAAGTILPTPDGGTRTEFVVTAHLRCSLNAALTLKDAIEKAIEMMKKSENDAHAPTGATLN
jgi:hypothetical protein